MAADGKDQAPYRCIGGRKVNVEHSYSGAAGNSGRGVGYCVSGCLGDRDRCGRLVYRLVVVARYSSEWPGGPSRRHNRSGHLGRRHHDSPGGQRARVLGHRRGLRDRGRRGAPPPPPTARVTTPTPAPTAPSTRHSSTATVAPRFRVVPSPIPAPLIAPSSSSSATGTRPTPVAIWRVLAVTTSPTSKVTI